MAKHAPPPSGRSRPRTRVWADAVHDRRQALHRRTEPLRRRARPVTDYVGTPGWLVLAAIVVSFVLADVGHWGEFALAGWTLLAVAVLCVLLTVGRAQIVAGLSLDPSRVRAGERAAGEVQLVNLGRGRVLPLAVELRVGRGIGRFTMPGLAPGARFTERFDIPTVRRGVVPVGPITTVRGDPFGLLHRTVRWTDMLELFVHPRLTDLEPLDSGLLRDLEGRTTNDLSVSDLAFHALREYEPGDDRRYIHWKSTARALAGRPDATFLVRQFLDTRRSHLCVVVDADDRTYDDPEDFETAISAAASIAIRGIRDETNVTVVVADQVVHEGTGQRTLDAFARAQADRTPLSTQAGRALRVAPATSIALLVTGAGADFAQLRKAAATFSVDVPVVALRIAPGQPAGLTAASGLTMLSVAELADLPRVLAPQVWR